MTGSPMTGSPITGSPTAQSQKATRNTLGKSSLNGTMMQYFHWYIADDGQFWNTVKANADDLAQAGFTAMWLPPAYKGLNGKSDVGYGVYDLFDLGEFDQKDSVRTKYGTKDEYLGAIAALHRHGVQVYADTVLNHKMGGDEPEMPLATPFPQGDRLNPRSGLQQIKTYSFYNFPGRKGQHSKFEWHWYHFDAVDYNEYNRDDRSTVYLFEGKRFDDYVALENGNYSYLMGCDLDFQDADVRDEITRWGKWYLDTTQVDGFRLDAIKHISSWFFPTWLDAMEQHAGRDLFVVGEYWQDSLGAIQSYLDRLGGRMSVFDVPLHYNFHRASKGGGFYDMRKILDGTLMQQCPIAAVTFVENHDSQPCQALESAVEEWFKPLAYALILLRAEGYPSVFYADYYGAQYSDKGRDITIPAHRPIIDLLLEARTTYAYGPQYDYFDHPDVIGWTRLGDKAHPATLAVMMSDGPGGSKWMETGKPNQMYRDLTSHTLAPITTNKDGWGEFRCEGGSVSVWIEV
jgi:alpha-amylase